MTSLEINLMKIYLPSCLGCFLEWSEELSVESQKRTYSHLPGRICLPPRVLNFQMVAEVKNALFFTSTISDTRLDISYDYNWSPGISDHFTGIK